jgi:endoglucanase
MFTVKNGLIIKDGKEFRIRGVNTGGWLMREGYILGGRNIPEHSFWENLSKKAGKGTSLKVRDIFENNFITAKDFQRIKKLGFNTIRLPFNSRMFLAGKGDINTSALQRMKKIVDAIGQNGLFVILDMHSAPGSQNCDWHSDSNGKALFWEKRSSQLLFLKIWKALSGVFKEHPAVIGYDILNEPNNDAVNEIYGVFEKALHSIRRNGDNKILFLEGNDWSQDISFLAPLADKNENIVLSIHCYHPVHYTFNLVKGLTYPGIIGGRKFGFRDLHSHYKKYADFARRHRVPIYAGEFGTSSRCACCHSEFRWVDDIIRIFDEFGWHWTYWTYKAVAGMMYPDGLFQLNRNPFWVKREGNVFGWETLYDLKSSQLAEFQRTIRTEYFDLNLGLMRILKKHL